MSFSSYDTFMPDSVTVATQRTLSDGDVGAVSLSVGKVVAAASVYVKVTGWIPQSNNFA